MKKEVKMSLGINFYSYLLYLLPACDFL